ncbi:bacterial proteasome activator family protein [Cellulomonas sp. P22]|uniref:bacterial proteasome activator family protein n=1 Tax=Cellulomonas sp. P22 TaxID=3373189 RepID=UPI0037BA9D3F
MAESTGTTPQDERDEHPERDGEPSDKEQRTAPETAPGQGAGSPQVVVVGPDGRPLVVSAAASVAHGEGEPESTDEDGEKKPRPMVGEPAKVMRIGSMVKQLLEEVRSAPLDEAARARLVEVHARSLHELEDGLSTELLDELHRITLPFGDDVVPSDAELRIAQAQLVGWLEGLFHGLQTALVAQQMAAQSQLAQMRRSLPSGVAVSGMVPQGAAAAQGAQPPPDPAHRPGQYL